MSAIAQPRKTCPRCHGRFEPQATFCPDDGTRLEDEHGPPSDTHLGTVIAGDLEILSVAGVGAMGRVYRAHQRGIDRDVAVKILHRELSANAQLVARFHREAKIASKLQHPHVVEMFLVGQLADGSLYMVMEFLDGGSLADTLREAGGMLALDRALAIMLQICDAVGAGHARGIVHRDLKPENIMLVRRADVAEWVKVLDFGIAKLTLGDQSMETAAGLVFGTARYISPEGAQGRQVGPPGDVYALATLLYQMLCGRTPFDAEPIGLLVKHIHEAPPELRTINDAGKAVPEAITRVVMQNLAKEPEERSANARVFGAALAAAAKEAGVVIADSGVLARMSQLPATSLSARVIEPTLDDVAAVRAVVVPSPETAKTEPIVPAPSAAPVKPDLTPAPAPAPVPRRGMSFGSLTIAFLLGTGLASAILFGWVFRPDSERHAFEQRTRGALAEGHYVQPPHENVRELVDEGLRRWPDDVELRQMRSAAEKEMITMAMAARGSGDLVGARNLTRDAIQLEGTDNSARYMRAQCAEELEGALNGPAARTGTPRLVFESPPLVKPGERVELTGRIVWGASAPSKLAGVKLTLFPNGQTTGAIPINVVSMDPNGIRATLVAPTPGSYDVSFEANASGTMVRAMRDLDVAP